MKRQRPAVVRTEPDSAELLKRQAKRRQVAAFKRRTIALGVEDGFSLAELGRAFIEAGADLVASATDGPGAASVLGATSARIVPTLPAESAREVAEQAFAGGRG